MCTYKDGFKIREDGTVSCATCQAMVVNNIPIHEQGCSNEKEDDSYLDYLMMEDDSLV